MTRVTVVKGASLIGGPLDGERLGERPYEVNIGGDVVKIAVMPPVRYEPIPREEVEIEHHVYCLQADETLAYQEPS